MYVGALCIWLYHFKPDMVKNWLEGDFVVNGMRYTDCLPFVGIACFGCSWIVAIWHDGWMSYGCLGDWCLLASGKVKMLAKYFVSLNLRHSWPPTPLHLCSETWQIHVSLLLFNMHRIFSLFTDCKLSWKAYEASRACYTPDTYISTATVGKYTNISSYMLDM